MRDPRHLLLVGLAFEASAHGKPPAMRLSPEFILSLFFYNLQEYAPFPEQAELAGR
jgi:hypothetical protein